MIPTHILTHLQRSPSTELIPHNVRHYESYTGENAKQPKIRSEITRMSQIRGSASAIFWDSWSLLNTKAFKAFDEYGILEHKYTHFLIGDLWIPLLAGSPGSLRVMKRNAHLSGSLKGSNHTR